MQTPPNPMSWQCAPGGQSLVCWQAAKGISGPVMQWRVPSTVGLLQPFPPEQSAFAAQTTAQLPLLRHC